MDVTTAGSGTGETARPGAGTVTVHYWASAKAAAGVAGDELPVDGPITLAEVVRRAVALHPGTRLPDVLRTCSTLLGDRPVSAEDPDGVLVAPGQTVEFLPPFAGG
ncbi:MoaD/ThiS family protein [Nocardioides sp. MAHUQ-72]|uniref:MoaD/ThiS family protein n=1 Tax=unclassified Nocardioides TaxID=2615069 RepID=UPI003611C471